MDYVQSTFENANEWLKAHDPLRFPEVDAVCISVSVGGGPYVGGSGCNSGSGGNGLGASASSSSSYSHSSSYSSNSFSSLGSGNSIGHGGVLNLPVLSVQDNPLLKMKTFEPTRISDNFGHINKFDHMGNIVNPNPNFPNIYVNIPTPEQENQNANGDNAQAGGSSEESKQEEANLKKAEDELRELKERHLKILDDTSKSSNEKAEGMGKAAQDVAEEIITRGTESVGAGVGFVAGGALGGPLGAAFGAVGGGMAGEKVAEYSIKKAKEVFDEREKEKEEL